MTAETASEIIQCPKCGTKNRVAADQREKVAVCGKCKEPLPAHNDQPIDVTDKTFDEVVTRSPCPVLLDLWAPWCGPCRMIAPIVKQIAGEYTGRVRVAKLDVDQNPQTAGRFNVASIPTLLILKNGNEFERIIGMADAGEIRERLAKVIR